MWVQRGHQRSSASSAGSGLFLGQAFAKFAPEAELSTGCSLQLISDPGIQALGLLAAAASWAVGRAAVSVAVLEALASFGKLWQMWLCSFARSFSALAPREACLEGHALATALPHAAAAPAPAPAVAVVLPGVGSGVGGAKCEGRAFARPSPNSLRGRCRSEGGPLACAGTGIALGPRPKFRAPEQSSLVTSWPSSCSGRLYGRGFDPG